MFETASDIFSTTVSTVYYSSQASSQQGGGSGSYLCQHARLNVKRLGRLVLRNQRYRVVHPHRVARGLVGSLQACQRKKKYFESAASSSLVASVAHRASLTLDGGGADNERLLEGLGLGAELGGPGLQGHALLREARDVDGGLLVEARLVVEQRDVAAEGQRLAASGGHL